MQIPTWLSDLAPLLAVLAILINIAINRLRHLHRRLEAEIKSPDYRARLIERHTSRAAEGYYLTLGHLMGWAERFYGPRWSLKALNRSLQLAYIYPLLAALIAWVVANQTAPGGLEMFQDVPEIAGRTWRALALLAAFAVAGYIMANAEKWSKNLRDGLRERLDKTSHRTGFLAKAVRWPPLVVESLAGAVAVAFAGAFAVAVGLAVTGDTGVAALVLFFLLYLPFTNALADWLSLGVTRALLSDLNARRPGSWGLALHLFVDLLAGLFFLALLLATLVGTLELWAWAAPASLPFDWRTYWQAALASPSQGTTLWLMVLTTLLPTLVHAVWALTLWQAQKSDHRPYPPSGREDARYGC